MACCILCREEHAVRQLDRVSGLDLCAPCRIADPAEALQARGIPVEWSARLGWFHAGLGLPGADPDFRLVCVPEQLHHKVLKWVVQEVEVGDPVFDRRVYVRTSDPTRARQLLGTEGLQSALLAFLTDVKVNELMANHVTLDGPTLKLGSRPLESLTLDRIQELKIETAALAIHLSAPDSPAVD